MKDTTVSVRVESDVKNEAEGILQNLGVPVSVVINSLYRQIIYRRGIPFPLTVPSEPGTMDAMSNTEFDANPSTAARSLLPVRGDRLMMYSMIRKGNCASEFLRHYHDVGCGSIDQ